MCIYPTKIKNKRYLPTRKNGYRPPICHDERLRYVEVECGMCRECLRKKGREWRIRNYEQLKQTPTAVFFTGTFTDERIEYLSKKYNINKEDANKIATKETRLFLERIRKYNKGKSIKHWIVTEKGHTNTRRIHIHGIFYAENNHTQQSLKWLLRNEWIAGYSYNGKYVNERTINYVSKYLTKIDEDNRDFRGIVLCSPGLGKEYVNRNRKRFEWRGDKSKEDYYCRNGQKIALPRYYKEKLYTEEQRELLWIYREERGEKYVNGYKMYVRTEEEMHEYDRLRKQRREDIEGTFKETITDILIKKGSNRINNRSKYKQKLIELYGKELRQRQRADKKLCEDINEFKKGYRGKDQYW
ncbi:replication initiator protein [Sigmofec virus UA08Rod_4510]|uniref:Replication initiator protein n=1 Tax=Sigmofec virus UA08Rod_4510 TaxID=2929402 RepID=A0A976R725_9VIRU|nr:replication initiator protein [Sigmofec virus UA08Rod_4510]